MLEQIKIGCYYCCEPSIQIENFRPLVGDDLIEEVLELAADLRNIRICHINATPFGGGVAELLSREIPILKTLKVHADWRIIHMDQELFSHKEQRGQQHFYIRDLI